MGTSASQRLNGLRARQAAGAKPRWCVRGGMRARERNYTIRAVSITLPTSLSRDKRTPPAGAAAQHSPDVGPAKQLRHGVWVSRCVEFAGCRAEAWMCVRAGCIMCGQKKNNKSYWLAKNANRRGWGFIQLPRKFLFLH